MIKYMMTELDDNKTVTLRLLTLWYILSVSVGGMGIFLAASSASNVEIILLRSISKKSSSSSTTTGSIVSGGLKDGFIEG